MEYLCAATGGGRVLGPIGLAREQSHVQEGLNYINTLKSTWTLEKMEYKEGQWILQLDGNSRL